MGELPEIEVICVLYRRVTLIHLSGKLSFEFFCFFKVRSDFLFLPEFSVYTLSDKRKSTGPIIVQIITDDRWQQKQTGLQSFSLISFHTNGFKIKSIKIWLSYITVMTHTHRRYLISALKLASAAWWIPFLVTSSSFSSAMVRSLRLSFPSRLKFKACKKKTNKKITDSIFFANIILYLFALFAENENKCVCVSFANHFLLNCRNSKYLNNGHSHNYNDYSVVPAGSQCCFLFPLPSRHPGCIRLEWNRYHHQGWRRDACQCCWSGQKEWLSCGLPHQRAAWGGKNRVRSCENGKLISKFPLNTLWEIKCNLKPSLQLLYYRGNGNQQYVFQLFQMKDLTI